MASFTKAVEGYSKAKGSYDKGLMYYGIIAAQVAAGYKAYQGSKKAYEKIAKALYKENYVGDMDERWAASRQVAEKYRAEGFVASRAKALPGGTGRGRAREFNERNWSKINAPGTRHLQARLENYALYVRSPFAEDLETFSNLVDEHKNGKDAVAAEKDLPKFTYHYSWDGKNWDYQGDIKSRPMSSVFLPAESEADILKDLNSFLSSRERLERLQLPWRRGYMFAGPPGTGKTSLAQAIASQLQFQINTISLSDVESDKELQKAISKVGGSTVVVIEDVDAFGVTHAREEGNAGEKKGLTLSGVLNALDGIGTPSGLVTIITTNHPEALDEALTREGRIDRTFTLGHVASAEVVRMWEWFYEEKALEMAAVPAEDVPTSPAAVLEIFKQHMNDAEAGWEAVVEHFTPEDETEEPVVPLGFTPTIAYAA